MAALHNRVDARILREQMRRSGEDRTTLSFYKYHHIDQPHQFRDWWFLKLSDIGVLGRIYVAHEGVNAQISVPTAHMVAFDHIMADTGFLGTVRRNYAVDDNGKSFFKLKILVREKILADGLDDSTFDPGNSGVHLKAEAFNQLTEDPNTLVIDMRNHYESEVGHFEGAVTPDVTTFRESLPVIADLLKQHADKNIVMYCTGGIRCEKASAWFKHQGLKNVFQLEGGIIEYSRRCQQLGLPNKFKGVNFVFDERLGERISADVISRCHQCAQPADNHTNCANDACHLLFIQCAACAASMQGCCSDVCVAFNALPVEERLVQRKWQRFNGSRFGAHGYRPEFKALTVANKTLQLRAEPQKIERLLNEQG
jgi:UPF0176 protein